MTSLCFLWEIIHSDFTKYLHQKIFRPSIQAIVIIYSGKLLSLSEQATFSIRAGCFLFSSSLYSLSNIPNPSRKDSRTSKSPQPSYKQSPQPFYKQSTQPFYKTKHTAILQAKAHSHTTSLLLKKTLRKQANPAKYPQYSTL